MNNMANSGGLMLHVGNLCVTLEINQSLTCLTIPHFCMCMYDNTNQ